ncbi:DMT family transporter [Shimia ponticola]|uniref:DMT family transporter n=1 Tax=Shimia ponticola TaxID=2582893 RepID=UPI0011BD9957|nr:DMT family transporter [Shimia ponticola]
MQSKDSLDTFGIISLVAFALLLAFNQVAIAVGGDGFQPVFMAGLRSVGAAIVLAVWTRFRRIPIAISRDLWPIAALMGAVFGGEFILLFTALDLTSVSRASVIFYSMPFWATLGAHFLLREHISRQKILGLVAAFAGVTLAIWDGTNDASGSLAGDLAALGASTGWAAILLIVKGSKARDLPPEVQLFWQVLGSIPVLMFAALFFGPFVRELEFVHWAVLSFQILCIASFGFLFWFWLLKIYPATSVASFSFLSPVFSVALGAMILGEEVGPNLLLALGFVVLGLVLINRRQVPQKV